MKSLPCDKIRDMQQIMYVIKEDYLKGNNNNTNNMSQYFSLF